MRYFETRKARIEIIPMIDIMLFLLVFFAMMTLRMIPTSGQLSKLPTSTTAATMPPPKLLIEINAAGVYRVEGAALTLVEIEALARQRQPEKLMVTIAGGEDATLQEVMHVIDAVRHAGVTQVGFGSPAWSIAVMIDAAVTRPVTKTWQAAGMASLIEALLVLVVVYAATHTVPPATQTFMPLVIEPVAEEPKPPVVEPEPPKPPEPVKAVVEPVKPLPVVHPAEVKAVPIEPMPERRAEPQTAEVVTEARAPVQQETVVAPKVESEDPSIAYNAALTMAVQAAFHVPAAAVTLGFKGRARVEFKLQDGHVSSVSVVQSSTLGVVDRAALRAVADANYPSPPVALAGIMGTYQIWVECR